MGKMGKMEDEDVLIRLRKPGKSEVGFKAFEIIWWHFAQLWYYVLRMGSAKLNNHL
jgi:hypothetical protein